MPAGKYSFYLHTDDRTDMLVSATLETISQPLRGDFLRTATTAGGVLYRIDTRLPALITELFDGKLYAVQLTCLIGALNGLLPASPAAEVRRLCLPGDGLKPAATNPMSGGALPCSCRRQMPPSA